MRKTSHDGGDSTSITSGVENEVKKSAMKPKKSSLKRRAPNFSHESDDTVIEPLLQKDKEKTESTPSAKYFTKGKTDTTNNKEFENKIITNSTTGFCGTTESLLSVKDSDSTKTASSIVAPIHNYMNTNVFNTYGDSKAKVTTKSQILVEIDGSKQSGYNPSPLIFTTAKIHTDGKSKNLEPLHVTPVPILSTTEVSITKAGSVNVNEKKVSNGSSIISADYSPISFSKTKEEKVTVNNIGAVLTSTTNKETPVTPTASTSKLSNTTSVQSSFKDKSLPSTTTKLVSTMSSKDKQMKDVEKILPKTKQDPLKSFDLNNVKNDVTVTTPSSGKVNVIDMSIKSEKSCHSDNMNQTDKSQKSKLDAILDNKISSNESTSDVQPFTSTSSKSSIRTQPTDPAKTISTTSGNKQLQRQQKTLSDETSSVELKTNANIKDSQDSSAKKILSVNDASHNKVIDRSVVKDCDKLPKISANNNKNINTKSALNTTANNVTSISMPKPTVTSVGISNTITTPTNVISKPSTNIEKKISPTITTMNAVSNINKTSTITTPTTDATAIAKTSAQNAVRATAIPLTSAVKSPELTSAQLISSVDKTISVKKDVVTNSAVIKTTPVSSFNSKAVIVPKPSATSTSASMPIFTTTSTSVSSVTSTNIKPPSIVSQSITNTKTPTTSVGLSTILKASVVTTVTKMTPVSTIAPITTTSQKHASVPVTANKQPMATTITSVVTKKPSPINSNAIASNTATVKSPSNNPSQISELSKPPPTSGSKINSSVTLPKTAAVNLTAGVPATSTIKSAKGTSPATTTTKDASISAKKSVVVKTPSVTTSQTSVRKSVAAVSTKALSSAVSSAPTTTIKQSATSIGKSVLSKSPSVTTSTNTSSVTSVSNTTNSTTSKPSTTSSTQVSSYKPVAAAGASQPSSTSISRPLDTTIKEDSKSSERKKDDKHSKA